jgi:hypothetical protein
MPAIDSNHKLLLHFDESGPWVDSSLTPKTMTDVGSVTLDTSEKKFGPASANFTPNDKITTPDHADWDFGTDDFTLEAWVYTAGGIVAAIASHANAASSYAGWYWNVTAADKLAFSTNDNTNVLLSTTAISTGQWVHAVVTVISNTMYHYIDGTRDATTWDASGGIQAASGTPDLTIGANQAIQWWTGGLDELAISDVARYTGASFTVPTGPYATLPPPGGFIPSIAAMLRRR